MTVDRDQIRRDADSYLRTLDRSDPKLQWSIMFAERCLALLAELERVEARLAKVPALVEALRRIHEAAEWQIGGKEAMHVDRVFILCRDALAASESE